MSANFQFAVQEAKATLRVYGDLVDTGRWQGIPTQGKPDLMTVELLNWSCEVPMPQTMKEAQNDIQPNLPWAEDHFQERVGGIPMNPDPSYEHWPWWKGQAGAAMVADRKVFTHTYSERFWPKHAGYDDVLPKNKLEEIQRYRPNRRGIRYEYGDLNDVIAMLANDPYTRQAYLPIFFPEDTGAGHGGRIPCTLGYHFMLRGNSLHMWYEIRSCDFIRHLKDDLYLAVRLCQHVLKELYDQTRSTTNPGTGIWENVEPGNLYFLAHSLHYHKGDEHLL